jgi:hypothetical protein
MHETSDVVTAKEWYVVTKLLPNQFHEAPPMARFLVPHAVEDRRPSPKALAEALGEIAIDPLVFSFKRDG